MARSYGVPILACAAAALLLQGCASKQSQAGNPFEAAIQSRFLRSCFAANHVKAQTLRQEAVCGCALTDIERAFSQDEFSVIDRELSDGQKPDADLGGFVRVCAARLTVPKKAR